jgi:hypothetical protein
VRSRTFSDAQLGVHEENMATPRRGRGRAREDDNSACHVIRQLIIAISPRDPSCAAPRPRASPPAAQRSGSLAPHLLARARASLAAQHARKWVSP